MKRIIMALSCAIAMRYGASGADAIGDVHVTNIERAISELRHVVSNDIATAHYDFSAILGEIKCVKSEPVRQELIAQLVSPLFDARNDQWKAKGKTDMTIEKDHLLRLALEALPGEEHILFKWSCHLERIKSLKKELAFYNDARDPEDVMRESLPGLTEDLKQECERRRTQTGDKVIVISGPVDLPKEVNDARARWGYKKWLEAHIKQYERKVFDTGVRFRAEYAKLPINIRIQLMKMVHEALGRYPDWYLEDKKKAAK